MGALEEFMKAMRLTPSTAYATSAVTDALHKRQLMMAQLSSKFPEKPVKEGKAEKVPLQAFCKKCQNHNVYHTEQACSGYGRGEKRGNRDRDRERDRDRDRDRRDDRRDDRRSPPRRRSNSPPKTKPAEKSSGS